MDVELLVDLERDEGFVSYAYLDSEGYWTIGIGTLIDRRKGGGITHDEAVYLLRNRVAKFEKELDSALPWWRTLDPVRQRVIVNMAYNLGVGSNTPPRTGLLAFVNTLAAVREGRWEDASRGMLSSRWASQVGARANRLAEAMKTGKASKRT